MPVFPVQSYGLATYFLAYPGTVWLRVETLLAIVRDFVSSVHRQSFRRLLIVNCHCGNSPIAALAQELVAELPDLSLRFHSWWFAAKATPQLLRIGPDASHAN